MIKRPLRLLLIEDSADDAELLTRGLKRADIEPRVVRVEDEKGLRKALAKGEYDLAITDHELRSFNSADVLRALSEMAAGVPCVLVSGKVGEEVVGQAMRQGAVDYVAKDNLWRLPAALERALADRKKAEERAAADAALARSGRLFEAVFLNARDAMLIVDDEQCLVNVNPAAAEMLAMTRDELKKLSADDLLPPPSGSDAPTSWEDLRTAAGRRGEVELQRADGSLVPTEYTVAADFLPGRTVMVIRDIRDRRAAEAEASRRISQQQAIAELGERALREESLDSLMRLAAKRIAATPGVEIARVLEARAGEQTTVTRAEVGLAQMDAAPMSDPNGQRGRSQPSFTLAQGQAVLVDDYDDEVRFDQPDPFKASGVRSALSVEIPGRPVPFGVLEIGSRELRAFNAEDATFLTAVAHLLAKAVERAANEGELRRRSLHDPMTGLPNRTLFFDRLNLAIARSKRQRTRVAVLFLDIDNFQSFNDNLGHLGADQLLRRIGARIQEAVRDTDTVARFGGDEFVVLFEDIASTGDEIEHLIDRVFSAFDAPVSLDTGPYRVRPSVGVALSDAKVRTAEALVHDADIAMYASKRGGGAGWTIASDEMRVEAADRVDTTRSLKLAIENDELLLHYQPIVSIADSQLTSVEALVRWEHSERGLVPPAQFIPIAEESGLIIALGDWVLRAACRQAARWREEFGAEAPLPVQVNLSARQVGQSDLPATVRRILGETGVPPSDIALEITETSLIEGVGGPIEVLAELRKMGIKVYLDDFGTGYSSLSYLDRFPIDTLKIDRAFVSQVDSTTAPAPIITAIVGMARALDLGTVAEGVETAEQAAAVADLGCTHAQGYFFARPAPADEISALVRDDSPLQERISESRTVRVLSSGAPAQPAVAGLPPATSAGAIDLPAG